MTNLQRRSRWWILLAVLALQGIAAAQEAPESPEPEADPGSIIEGLDEMIHAFVGIRRWEGERTSGPEPSERPAAAYHLDAPYRLLSVHAEESFPVEKAAEALRILQGVAARLEDEGWHAPLTDGGRGGTDGFDLYLSPTDGLAEARSDGRMIWSYLDAAVAHGVVDPSLTGVDLEAAITSAYAQAILLNLDPAEALSWRRATGAWLAWRLTGQMGPADAANLQQEQSARSWIAKAADDGEGGALLLAMISERHDGGSGVFVRELWQLARQRTWEGTGLRAAPDLWQALDRVLHVSGSQLHAVIEDFAVARWFMGANDEHNVFSALRGLGSDASVKPMFTPSLADMPVHTRASVPIEPYGSAYALIDVRGAPPEHRLRIWLRGEYGVEWALTASPLDGSGRELSRLSAPPRRGDRRSYLPVELTANATHVMVSVTNLSHRLPDADDPNDPNARAFRLIFDLVGEGQEPDYGQPE